MRSTLAETKNGRDHPEEVFHRDGTGGLVYKTHVQQDREPAVTAPRMAPGETIVWWKWTQEYVAHRLDVLSEAVGEVVGIKARAVRDDLSAEIDLLRRQLLQLRAEFDADRGIKALHAEVASARADVPKVPDLVARFEAKQAASTREMARLRRELAATKERLTLVHMELGKTRFGLTELERKPPTVEVNCRRQNLNSVSRTATPRRRSSGGSSSNGQLKRPHRTQIRLCRSQKPASRCRPMARRTDRAVAGLRDLARAQSTAAPPGYEHYSVAWDTLTPRETAIVCAFADVLKEVREHELDLLRLGTVDRIRALTAELSRQAAEMAAAIKQREETGRVASSIE